MQHDFAAASARRPPVFAASCLRILVSGAVAYRQGKPWWTGQTELVLAPHDFLRRLAALLPAKGQHTVRFHGCFGPGPPAANRNSTA